MRLSHTLLAALLVIVCCSCTTDITKNPTSRTDFITGGIYEIKRAVWVRNGSLMTLRDKEPLDSEGRIGPGTRVVVRQIMLFRSPEMGTHTEVFAEVLSGDFKGRTVDLSVISERSPTGYTRRDPAMLEAVQTEAK